MKTVIGVLMLLAFCLMPFYLAGGFAIVLQVLLLLGFVVIAAVWIALALYLILAGTQAKAKG